MTEATRDWRRVLPQWTGVKIKKTRARTRQTRLPGNFTLAQMARGSSSFQLPTIRRCLHECANDYRETAVEHTVCASSSTSVGATAASALQTPRRVPFSTLHS